MCVRAYGSAQMRAHVSLCMFLCMHARPSVDAFVGVCQRICGLCVRACVRASLYTCMIYAGAVCVRTRTCVRTRM